MAEYVCEVTERCTEYGALTDYELRERVVRCRDCAFYSDDIGGFCTLLEFSHSNDMADGFCAWGKERDS